jgi:hypothetical protein
MKSAGRQASDEVPGGLSEIRAPIKEKPNDPLLVARPGRP